MSTAQNNEELHAIDIGVSSADAESVQLHYQFGDLLIRYNDWQEREREKKFFDVLAFRWQEFDDDAPRNDASYEVLHSQWLNAQAKAQEVNADAYVHHRICFNNNGVLDVVSLRNDVQPSTSISSS